MENEKLKIRIDRNQWILSRQLSLVALALAALMVCTAVAEGQDLPGKIRGYKVYEAKIVVKTHDQRPQAPEAESKNDAFITVGEPKLIKVSLTGITFQLTASLDSIEQSGTVDFLTFHDFRVNGRNVDIEDYEEKFDFKKNETIDLPKPVAIVVSVPQGVLGALGEVWDSKERWRVTGRVFVFGRFKKAGVKFKRVVPVDIDIMITNPAKSKGII